MQRLFYMAKGQAMFWMWKIMERVKFKSLNKNQIWKKIYYIFPRIIWIIFLFGSKTIFYMRVIIYILFLRMVCEFFPEKENQENMLNIQGWKTWWYKTLKIIELNLKAKGLALNWSFIDRILFYSRKNIPRELCRNYCRNNISRDLWSS